MQAHVFTIKQIQWDHELLVPGPMWPDTKFAATFDKHFLHTHTITGMPSSSFCFHFCRCRSGATTLKLRKDADEKINHKCVLVQPQALAWGSWQLWGTCFTDTWAQRCFYTKHAGEPDNAVALSAEVNPVLECPQISAYIHSQENTHIASTKYPPKMSRATETKVITSILTLELSCLEGLYWCPLLPLSWHVTACSFPAWETAWGVGTRNPWPFSYPSHGLIINACYTFSFKIDWQQGVAKHFVWELSEKDFAGGNLHGWISFNFLPFTEYSWNGFIFS